MTPGQDEEWTLSVLHTDADLQRYVDVFETFARDVTGPLDRSSGGGEATFPAAGSGYSFRPWLLARSNDASRSTSAGRPCATEVLGGFVTFLTMAYIVFVNPAILSVGRAAVRGGRRRHLAGRGDLHAADGPADEPAVRAGVRARAQRGRRLRPDPRPPAAVAGRDGLRGDRGRGRARARHRRPARGDHARRPAGDQALDRRRHRALHRARRLPRRGHHGQRPRDGDRPRRPHRRRAADRAGRTAGDDHPDRARVPGRDPASASSSRPRSA